ncbi:probable S-adenosylmethionine decarboxylase [Sorangium cellulosum So ce56]|uniref:Probable S-adenosylmethionine decarboxylase n=2 Tax=Sorangium cellulosum TaxID=56 RepID=A9G7C3_SORC5|nr:probable S-adenosylmethionine decarboxylase [Sorangium cellulosum So ce56]
MPGLGYPRRPARAAARARSPMQLFVALALFEGCPSDFLNSPAALRGALEAAVAAGSFTLLEMAVVPFSPQGITACAVVGESHVALHSWPESGRLFVDVASCSTLESVRRAVAAIGSALPEGRLATLDERIVDPAGARAP